jgi:hypothetical protein
VKRALILTLLVPLSACSPGARVLNSGYGNISPCFTPDPRVLVKIQPHCTGWSERLGRRSFVSYNRLGHRDRDYPLYPTKGTFRILIMDSSLMAGPGIDERDTVPRKIEKNLRDRGINVEVVNAAVDGYTEAQHAILMREYLDAYHPNLVISYVADKSFTDHNTGNIDWSSTGEPLSIKVKSLDWVPSNYLRGLIYANKAAFKINNSIFVAVRSAYLSWSVFLSRNYRPLIEPVSEHLTYMKRVSEKQNAKFFVFLLNGDKDALLVSNLYTSYLTMKALSFFIYNYSIPFSEIENELTRRQLPFHSLEDLHDSPDDMHVTAEAAAKWADRLVAVMLEKKLIPAKKFSK